MRLIILLILLLLQLPAFAEIKIVPDNSCTKLKEINLSENNILEKDNQAKIFKPYMYKCIDDIALKNIISDISKFYRQKGYITTLPYLKAQNINDGKLDILISIGTISDVIHSETNKTSLKISTAFVLQKNEPLNLRDIETALETMNRVPSSRASFQINPGEKQGSSIIVINTKKTNPLHISLGINGSKKINDDNPYLTLNTSIDNLLDINDILSINYNGSNIQKEYQSTLGKEFNYSFPIGSYVFEFILSDTSYRQGVSGINGTYLLDGDTRGIKFKINKVIARNQIHKLTFSTLLNNKDSKNYFANEPIEVSSYRTTQIRLSLIHDYLKHFGSITTTYAYHQGLDWLDARDDKRNVEIDFQNQAKLQFTKHSLNTNLTYYLKDKSYAINSNFHIQITDDYLYNNDKLSVGNSYTVRGYSIYNLSGNNGWYLKNNITKTIQFKSSARLLSSLSMFLGLDYGEVECQTDNPEKCGNIYGGAMGFRTNGKHLSSSLVWSYPFKKLNSEFNLQNLFKFGITIIY